MELESIKVALIQTASDKMIGRISLNKPKALNALDLEMIKIIQAQLDKWRNDENIAAVFLDSVVEKAFCAGGDIVSMYNAMSAEKQNKPGHLPDFMAQFFAAEYQLDYTIHAYPKPIICWGNGIIMGGGMGLFMGADIRIVDEKARIAMPEITIGLFPDVGASYFLNKLPPGVGKFLGLTATAINCFDCLETGLATHILNSDTKDIFVKKLGKLESVNKESINSLIETIDKTASAMPAISDGKISGLLNDLKALHNLTDIAGINTLLNGLIDRKQDETQLSKLLQKAKSSLNHGSPITAILVIEQLERGKHLSLADCFRMELNIAYQCSVNGEFQEGVRALLIDKDNKPKWLYTDYQDVPVEIIEAHFADNLGQNNPLIDLEARYGDYHE